MSFPSFTGNHQFSAFIDSLMMTENHYKEVEKQFPVPEMTAEQLAELNEALNVSPKGVDYRPYCCNMKCERMPRMYRIANGFKCWGCNNEIGFNLRQLGTIDNKGD